MNLDRRNFIIKSIGAAICAGATPMFMPSLVGGGGGFLYSHQARAFKEMYDNAMYSSAKDLLLFGKGSIVISWEGNDTKVSHIPAES